MTCKERLFDALERIIELLSPPDNLEASLLEIANCLRETFPSNGCRILIHSPQNNTLTFCDASSPVKAVESPPLSTNGGVIGYLYENQRPLFVRRVSELPIEPSEGEVALFGPPPMTLTPIIENGFLCGVLCLRNRKAAPFGAEETRVLSLICRIIGGLLRTAQIDGSTREGMDGYQSESPIDNSDREVRELLFLNEASKALLATMDLDQILYAVLTAITLGEGLGFNRAMVFLFDEKNRGLKGEMAIGPDNPAEAQRIWTDLSTKPRQNLSDLIGKLERRSEISHLNGWVRQMNIPTDGSMCFFERTFREGRSFCVHSRCWESGKNISPRCLLGGHPTISGACDIHRRIIPGDIPHDCASVPLWGKERVIGTISVDNIFNQKSIGREEIRLLETFTRQAGAAIEHSMVVHGIESSNRELMRSQEMLIQSEKMAALRQMTANVAHTIKNPLVSIGGFARRLDKTLGPNASTKKYTQTMIRETDRLESILNGILDYSIDRKPWLGTHDFNEIVRNALDHIVGTWRGSEILVLRDFEPGLPGICCNDRQIRQVILNILSNASDAMNGRGKLSVKTYSLEQDNRNWVAVEIMDSGGGIPQEVLHNIFNPFFSTQSKETGLGLAICHRIVTSHHGSITVDNRPGQGVRFIVKLPQDQQGELIRSNGTFVDPL